MESHYSFEVRQPFVLGEEQLKKLTDLLSDRMGDVKIEADCVDGVARTFKSIKELVAFENPKEKEIRRIRFLAQSKDLNKRGTVVFSSSSWAGISLDFQARDDVVSRLRTESLDLIGGMRPWYAGLHRINFFYLSFLAYLVMWIGSLLILTFRAKPAGGNKESDPVVSAWGQLMVFGLVAVLMVVAIVMERFRDTVFPRAVFKIGQGKARFEHLERIQWCVVIAFLVSFVSGAAIAIWQATLGNN